MYIMLCFYYWVRFYALNLLISLVFLVFDIQLSTFITFYNVLFCFTICYKRFTLCYYCITFAACCSCYEIRFLTMCALYLSSQSVRLIALSRRKSCSVKTCKNSKFLNSTSKTLCIALNRAPHQTAPHQTTPTQQDDLRNSRE